ncbi:hypothetical protein [Brevundimonas diminuta]|uniref:hypothetical protein n=1 Tax=Brevundimonas diminuta TaxID=293 RepID=UPI003F7DB8AA
MTNNEPRGTVERTFLTADGRTMAIIEWTRGAGPQSAAGDFQVGQSVTVRDGEVVQV